MLWYLFKLWNIIFKSVYFLLSLKRIVVQSNNIYNQGRGLSLKKSMTKSLESFSNDKFNIDIFRMLTLE